jgi:hypothetical protein
MNKAKKKLQKVKFRNPFAMHAFMRSGAGNHGSKKKKASRDACRDFRWKN